DRESMGSCMTHQDGVAVGSCTLGGSRRSLPGSRRLKHRKHLQLRHDRPEDHAAGGGGGCFGTAQEMACRLLSAKPRVAKLRSLSKVKRTWNVWLLGP